MGPQLLHYTRGKCPGKRPLLLAAIKADFGFFQGHQAGIDLVINQIQKAFQLFPGIDELNNDGQIFGQPPDFKRTFEPSDCPWSLKFPMHLWI
jgi:hypothetical protein